MIRVVIKKPGQPHYVENIAPTLDEFRSIVGGHIEGCRLVNDIMFYCNEEGKLQGLAPNFQIPNDVVVGSVVFFGNDGGELEQSLDDDSVNYLGGYLSAHSF